ncbi:MAG TPA: erythromycin esterase family protein [Tepidisphaeraceae bacterium]|jgi:erythromycin esterase-like protein|nr:erythromycin esterase family protein [Tepidisphaeraceae bacterium]
MITETTATLAALNDAAIELTGAAGSYDAIIDLAGDARIVLIGEASHGTHEFYAARAQITERLITERGFGAVIVEADWPDAYRVNRYVRGIESDGDRDAAAALDGFKRFPQWMWRNDVVVGFVEWLKRHNAALSAGDRQCGFYGMDLYSLYGSIDAVVEYLDKVDPEAARRARFRYGCFEQFEDDPQAYGYAASYDLDKSCRDGVIAQLVDLQRRASDLAKRDGQTPEDEYFFAEQNARLIKNAEEYYRQMFAGRVDTWNLRDTHMVDTIDALLRHLDRTRGRQTKVVVWAHNSHLGDARATEMGRRGELNVGQLCRQRWAGQVINVGFTTHTGTVTAAHNWGDAAQRMNVNPSLAGSYERLFHEVGLPQFLMIFRQSRDATALLTPERLERAIGVIYRPGSERLSHYFRASLPQQFDAVIQVDTTSALQPLERTAPFEPDAAETFPLPPGGGRG